MDTTDKKLLLKKRTVCELLECGNTKLHNLIAEGELQAVRLRGSTMITAASLDRLMANLEPVTLRKAGAAK